jgi:hypothetical protein
MAHAIERLNQEVHRMSNNSNKKRTSHLGIGMLFGVAIGAAFGIMLGNLALGIGPGIALGVAIALVMSSRESSKNDKSARDTKNSGDNDGGT